MSRIESIHRPLPAYAAPGNAHVDIIAAVVLFHLVACSAPFCFTWAGLATAAALVLATGLLGIVLGYHRLLAHRCYRTHPLLGRFFSLLGCLAMQNGPIGWVALHRYHHVEPDGEDDPHSPLTGVFWAHFGWTFFDHPKFRTFEDKARMAPDLARDRFLVFLERAIIPLNLLSALLLWLIGWAVGGTALGLSLLVWGFFLRIVYVWHITFIVNSAGHFWGYRNYDLGDNSKNLWWVSLISFGEGWHNNHHADPRSARLGHRWYEVDAGYLALRLMASVGLASHLAEPRCLDRIRTGTTVEEAS